VLTGMEDGVFPYTRIDSNGPEDEDDERRLAYVALTRARKYLFIVHASQRSLFGQTRYLAKSPFLQDIPHDCSQEESSPGRFAQSAQPYGAGRKTYDEFDQRPQYEEHAPASEPVYAPRMIAPKSAAPATKLSAADTDTKRTVVDQSAFDDLAYGEKSVTFRPGQLVYHGRFGKGRVERVESGGESLAVVAKFPGFGSRKILAKFLVQTTSSG